MALTPIEEKDALDNLVKSPGWLIFLEHAKKEWGGEGTGRRMKLAISGAKDAIAVEVQKVDFASDEVNILLSWPAKRVKQLTLDQTPVNRTDTTMIEYLGRAGR